MRNTTPPAMRRHFKEATTPPEGWRGDLSFTTPDGDHIRYGHAPALTRGEAKGTIVLTHGYGETSDLYYKAIKYYQRAGYNIFAMDWHGHGRSDHANPEVPEQPSTEGLARHVDDLDHFVRTIVQPAHQNETPLIMSTHSMGGHIGLLYLQQHPDVFNGAVMSAPMLDIHRFGLPEIFRPAISATFTAAAALGLKNVEIPGRIPLLSRIKAVGNSLRNMAAPPLTPAADWEETIRDLYPESRLNRPTFGWVAAAYKTILPSIDTERLQNINTPVLIGSASIENLVDNKTHAYAAEIMPQGRHVTIKNAEHSIWGSHGDVFQNWWGHVEQFVGNIHDSHNKNAPNELQTANLYKNIDAAGPGTLPPSAI